MTKIRANSNGKFLMRFLLIALVLLGYGLWSLYDSLVTGQKDSKIASTFWEQGEEDGKQVWKKKFDESSEEWIELAKKNNWKLVTPKNPSEVQGYLIYNYLMVVICLPGGLIALWKYYQANNTWIEADEKTLTNSRGVSFDFSDIVTVDKKKWDHKGIAKIFYNDDGATKKFVLDDFKYDREPTDQILKTMEKSLQDDQIVNGERESDSSQSSHSETV